MAERGRLLAVFAAVCQAVAYAHAHRVIHRDLKPANIMVGAFGEVQVMDWGLANLLGTTPTPATEPTVMEETRAWSEISPSPGSDAQYTQAGSLVGTPSYIPPEQAAGELEKVDERADVFGLGALLAVILTGKPPYVGETAESVRVMAVRGELKDCLARLDGCAAEAELVGLCKRCLAFNPADRPRDAGTVAEIVAAHLAAAEERARQAELDRVRATEQRKRRRTQFAAMLAIVGFFVVVGLSFVLVYLAVDAMRGWAAAESLRGKEQEQRGLAEIAQYEAEQARDAEKETREKLAVFEYGRTIQVAYDAWRDNNVAATLALLDGTRKDLRGWEWRYVHRLCHSDLLTIKGTVASASFSADGSRIITRSGGIAKEWDGRTGAEVLTLRGPNTNVYSLSLSADGSRIITKRTSRDKTPKVWDAKSGTEVSTLVGHADEVHSASFSGDGSRIVTGSLDSTAKVWEAQTGAELLTLKGHKSPVMSASFSADGSRIVTGGWDRMAKVWDAQNGAELLTLKGHQEVVSSAWFSADGSRIITADDKTAKVWSAQTGAELLTIKGHAPASFNADGSRIVTAGEDKAAKVWNAQTGAELLDLAGHNPRVSCASFSDDGFQIVTSDAKLVNVWDAKTGAKLLSFQHTGHVSCALFSADGSQIVTVAADRTVKVWDAKTGAVAHEFKGNVAALSSARLSPDGSRFVTGGADYRVNVWDAKTGAELLSLKGHLGPVSSATFSMDGTRIVTGSWDGTAKVWDSRPFRETLPKEPAPPPEGKKP